MSKNFYDNSYYGKTNEDITRKKIRADLVRENTFYKSILCPEAGRKLLDVGCGGGIYLAMLRDTNADLWGIDISENAVHIARQRMKKPEQILCASADPQPFSDDEFDYVTSWGVIEHFVSIPSIVNEIRRVVKPKGQIAISVPNVYYYKYIWDTLRKGTGPVKHQEIEVLYSFKEWKDIIEASGLLVIRTSRHNKFVQSPFMIALRDRVIPFYLSNHFVFVCQK